jgi:membrane associated rhomboid family serine protease
MLVRGNDARMARSHFKTFKEAVRISLALASVLFVVEAADLILRRQTALTLTVFGILPRSVPGLVGIAFSPLLHASPAHLLANALPLFILLILLFWDQHYYPTLTLCSIWFFSGLGTWLIGRAGTVHIGASSIIFGLVAYLIVAGFLMKSWRSAIIALIVLILFGGIFYSILPREGPISWEGHLSGALAGIWAAKRNHE